MLVIEANVIPVVAVVEVIAADNVDVTPLELPSDVDLKILYSF
jgi:hypothetical protein